MIFKRKKSPSPSPGTLTAEQLYNLNNPPLTPLSLDGYSTTTRNKLLTNELGEEIRGILPARLQIQSHWKLLYSLEQHGASLSTLYRSIKPETRYDKNGYVLLIKDSHGTVFGSFVNEHLHPTDLRRFYGNGECFLWKTSYVNDDGNQTLQFRAFPYTGLNDYIIYCTSEFISLGGGDGHYGLWIDHDLMKGVSDHCLTFGNDQLSSHGSKFDILGVEVWRVG